jgi:2-iminoacetate synthase ThiH
MRSDDDDNGKGKMSPEQVLKMLKEEGMDVTLEQAKLILEFLRKLAGITVSNYLKTKQ